MHVLWLEKRTLGHLRRLILNDAFHFYVFFSVFFSTKYNVKVKCHLGIARAADCAD